MCDFKQVPNPLWPQFPRVYWEQLRDPFDYKGEWSHRLGHAIPNRLGYYLFVTLSGVMAETENNKSLGNTQPASETLRTGLPSCQGGHPKRLTAHTWTDSSCLGLRSV